MENTNKGFVGIALIIILAIALGAGGTYYVTTKKNVDLQNNSTSTPSSQTQDKKASEVQEETSVAIKAPSASVTTGVNMSAPVNVAAKTSVNVNPNITWSFPIKQALPDAGKIIGVEVTIEGKKYDLGNDSNWCGVELEKSKLLPTQLSAARCGNGDFFEEFAVQKTVSGYIITRAEWNYYPETDGKTPDSQNSWRLRTKVIKTI